MMPRPPTRILMGPGPSAVAPSILTALSQPVLGHLDPLFLALLDKIQRMLREVFRTSNALTLAISGTGTAGMEAAVVNIVEPGDRVVVCVNGFFGARLAEMVRRCGGETIIVEAPWGRLVPAEAVASALSAAPGPVKALAIVHAETSTGVLQPLEEIISLAHQRDALVIVDAVTSLGGITVDVDALAGGQGIDVCYSGSQKCLGAPPGLAPITVSERAVDAMRRRRTPPVSFNLDLLLLANYWSGEHAYHHTAPSNTFYALDEALRLLLDEGLEARVARHRMVHEKLRHGVTGLGLKFFVPEAHRLPVLNTLIIPDGVDDRTVRTRLLDEHNIEIGGGLGPLAGKVWRVGVMGYSAREDNIARFLTAMRIILGAPRPTHPRRPG